MIEWSESSRPLARSSYDADRSITISLASRGRVIAAAAAAAAATTVATTRRNLLTTWAQFRQSQVRKMAKLASMMMMMLLLVRGVESRKSPITWAGETRYLARQLIASPLRVPLQAAFSGEAFESGQNHLTAIIFDCAEVRNKSNRNNHTL